MIAKLEKRYYAGNERVWVGEYKNLHNISHWHMEHELILCKTGTAHITLNEHEYSLTPGKGYSATVATSIQLMQGKTVFFLYH